MKRTATFYSLISSQSKINNSSAETGRRRKIVSPSESVISNILGYSKALAVLKTHESGYLNLVMN
ncbi:MAG: hypothetical protein NT004_00265 [Bacteroidetes bacterium]|nr:hypothetical protein [Bacteroidota bacterium]